MIYNNLKKNKNNKVEVQNRVLFHFVRGPFVEIKGPKVSNYLIKFIDNKTNKVHFTSEITNNCWARCSIEYFVEWKIEIFENGKLWFEHTYDAKDKRVYIALDSKALGDSLAWFPYVDEFRKKHKCKVIVSTFMNDMFETQYPELQFVKPGTNVENLYSMHTIGLFYNEDSSVNFFKNPIDPKAVTLQQMCSDILAKTKKS
jgi:autotransporter strand-loop-strand O-heptosyltransferase